MTNVRPKMLNNFLGQTPIVRQVSIAMASARERDCPFPHMIMGGPPGLGKTTLASIIANEMDGVIISRIASAITKPDDLISLFEQIEEMNTVIFIDEMEQLNRKISELFHTAMEDGIFTAKLKSGKLIKTELPEFTLMGATNYLGELPKPFLDRFKVQVNFEPYSEDEIYTILCGAVKKMGIKATETGARAIAKCSRGVPRVAIRFLDAARDVSLAYPDKYAGITSKCVAETFEVHEIDNLGLTDLDRRILEFLMRHEDSIGISALAQGVNEDDSTIEFNEGYLIRLDLISRTLRGREITESGKLHMRAYECQNK